MTTKNTAQDVVRVFHPSLSSFEDVPAGDVEDWVEAGWRKTAPKHIDADTLPPVGEHPGRVAVLEDTSRTTRTASTSTASTARASRSSSAAGRASSSGSAGSTTSTSGGSSAGATS